MYVDITSINYDKGAQVVTVEAVDLDSLLLNDWDQEIASMKAEKIFRFDLKLPGARKYLYLVAKSKGDPKATSLINQVESLVGKQLSLNDSFLVKALG